MGPPDREDRRENEDRLETMDQRDTKVQLERKAFKEILANPEEEFEDHPVILETLVRMDLKDLEARRESEDLVDHLETKAVAAPDLLVAREKRVLLVSMASLGNLDPRVNKVPPVSPVTSASPVLRVTEVRRVNQDTLVPPASVDVMVPLVNVVILVLLVTKDHRDHVVLRESLANAD